MSKWVSSIAIHNELLRRGRKVLLSCCLGHDAWSGSLALPACH